MKLNLTLLIVASICACVTSWTCKDSDWAKYKEDFNKSYDSTEDDIFHKNTFCENLIDLLSKNQDHKIGEANFKSDLSVFSDLSPSEQREYRKSHGFKRMRGTTTPKPTDEDEDEEVE